jgi:hypothetical protein
VCSVACLEVELGDRGDSGVWLPGQEAPPVPREIRTAKEARRCGNGCRGKRLDCSHTSVAL